MCTVLVSRVRRHWLSHLGPSLAGTSTILHIPCSPPNVRRCIVHNVARGATAATDKCERVTKLEATANFLAGATNRSVTISRRMRSLQLDANPGREPLQPEPLFRERWLGEAQCVGRGIEIFPFYKAADAEGLFEKPLKVLKKEKREQILKVDARLLLDWQTLAGAFKPLVDVLADFQTQSFNYLPFVVRITINFLNNLKLTEKAPLQLEYHKALYDELHPRVRWLWETMTEHGRELYSQHLLAARLHPTEHALNCLELIFEPSRVEHIRTDVDQQLADLFPVLLGMKEEEAAYNSMVKLGELSLQTLYRLMNDVPQQVRRF